EITEAVVFAVHEVTCGAGDDAVRVKRQIGGYSCRGFHARFVRRSLAPMTAIASRFQVWDEEDPRPGRVAVQGGPVGSMADATIGVGSVDVFASWSRRRGETHQKAGASAPRCHQPAPPPPVAPSIDPVLFTLAIHTVHAGDPSLSSTAAEGVWVRHGQRRREETTPVRAGITV